MWYINMCFTRAHQHVHKNTDMMHCVGACMHCASMYTHILCVCVCVCVCMWRDGQPLCFRYTQPHTLSVADKHSSSTTRHLVSNSSACRAASASLSCASLAGIAACSCSHVYPVWLSMPRASSWAVRAHACKGDDDGVVVVTGMGMVQVMGVI